MGISSGFIGNSRSDLMLHWRAIGSARVIRDA
jgi:hypothetical protein